MHLRYFSNEVNRPHDGRIPLFLITFVTSKFNTNRNKNNYVEDYFVLFRENPVCITGFPWKKHVDR